MISGFISRFEGNFAVIEQSNRTYAKVSRQKVPTFAKIGDFIEEDPGSKSFHIDLFITEKRRQEILRLADMFFE